MTRHRTLKLIHLAGRAWFLLWVGYILVFALRQAGVHWWIIFSVSGHSTLLALLMVSLYSFALFRGVGRSQTIEAEHPLTSTDYYMVFYIIAPIFWQPCRLRWNDRRKRNQAIPVGNRPGNFGSNLSGLGDCGPGGELAGDAIAINTWRIKTLTFLCPYAGNAKSHTFFPIARVFTFLKRSIYA